MNNWRDRVKVHPAADLFPMMSEAELDEMAADIAEHGLRETIACSYEGSSVLTGSPLVDGRNRLAAIDRIPDQERRKQLWDDALENARMTDDPYAYVVSANIRRRHLTTEQKRDVIAALLKAKPERSDRATAKIAHVDNKTVASVRAELSSTEEIPQLEKRIGTDGKARKQPASKAAYAAPPQEAIAQITFDALLPSGEEIAQLALDALPAERRLCVISGAAAALGYRLEQVTLH